MSYASISNSKIAESTLIGASFVSKYRKKQNIRILLLLNYIPN